MKRSLRATENEDLDFLADLANDPQVVGWGFPVSRHGQRRWLERIQGDDRSVRLMADDEQGRPIGLTGFWEIDWQARHAEIAIKLRGTALGGRRGCGTDVVMTRFADGFQELSLNQIWSPILAYNAASPQLFVGKCGMRVEGRQRQHVFRQGRFHDLLQVAIVREESDVHPLSADYEAAVAAIEIPEPIALLDEWMVG